MPSPGRARAGRAAAIVALLGASAVLTLLVAGLLGLMACSVDPASRSWRMSQRAASLAAAGDLAAADRLMVTVRERAPDAASYAVTHAAIKARRGEREAALQLLEHASSLGLSDEDELVGDLAFDALRSDPRFVTVVDAARARAASVRQKVEDARKPVDPASAPAFADYARLAEARDAAERRLYEGDDRGRAGEPYEVRRARFVEEWAAALIRLADARRGTPDEERARYELLRMRLRGVSSIRLEWREDAGAKVREAARAYLHAIPNGANVPAARIAAAMADALSVLPAGRDPDLGPAPRPRWEAALPVLADIAADGTANRWSTLATGLRAMALHELEPERQDEIRSAIAAYEAGPKPSWEDQNTLDLAPRWALKVVRWKMDGLPPLEGMTVQGRRVGLADFRGKLTLLDFWSPG